MVVDNERRGAVPFSIALVFLAGAAAARLLARYAPERLSVDFAQPLVVVTAWHAYGMACFAVLAATVALAAALTVRAGLGDPSRSPGRDVACAAAAAVAAAWAWPFVFSSDVYAYAAYGAMAASGSNPYDVVAQHGHGAFIDAARWQWGGTYPVCVYGPAFVLLVRAVLAAFGSFGVATTLFSLRALAAMAFVASIALLDLALRGRTRRRRWLALCAYGLNPVAIWSVAEGHNDAFVLLAVCGGAAFIRRGAAWTGAAYAGFSALLKATGVPLALGLALDAALFWPAGRSRPVVLGTIASLCIAAAIAVPPLVPALARVRSSGHYAPAASLQGFLGPLPVLALALATLAYGAVRLRARRRDGFAWLGIAAWLALPNPYPWYALWLLPAVLAAGEGFAAAALWGATISSVIRYLPDAAGEVGGDTRAWAAVAMALPLLLAALDLRPPTPIQKKATSP